MKKLRPFKSRTAVLVAGLFLVALFTPFARAQDDLAAAPRISIEELASLMASGKVVIVDVRDASSYMNGHLPGAILMPLSDVSSRWSQLPVNKTIVTYCG